MQFNFLFWDKLSVLSHLNVDQWVMARDRHRLNRLRKGKDANEKQYQELFEKSNHKVRERLSRLPNIRLNQDLPVTQSADQLIEAIQQTSSDYCGRGNRVG